MNFDRLDVLIQSAGIAIYENTGQSILNESYAGTSNTNIIGGALMMTIFILFMKKPSSNLWIADISSTGKHTSSGVTYYSTSKIALNATNVEHVKAESDVSLNTASPGHCRTASSYGFRGTKDPLDEGENSCGIDFGGERQWILAVGWR